MSDLKPCPFCGGEAGIGEYDSDPDGPFYFVNCTDCMASTNVLLGGQYRFTEAEAIAAWNTRATSSAPDVGELEDLVERLNNGVPAIGLHEDNNTELFDIEAADETMFEAAAILTALRGAQEAGQ